MRKRIIIIAAAMVLLLGIKLATPTCADEGVVLYWPIVKHQNHSSEFLERHKALDIVAPPGTVVYASASGTVVSAGWRTNGGGNVVEIDHGFGVHTIYNHLNSIFVMKGQPVTMNTPIGSVGTTGNSTGPHLHFAVTINGVFIDPTPQMNERAVLPDTAVKLIDACQ